MDQLPGGRSSSVLGASDVRSRIHMSPAGTEIVYYRATTSRSSPRNYIPVSGPHEMQLDVYRDPMRTVQLQSSPTHERSTREQPTLSSTTDFHTCSRNISACQIPLLPSHSAAQDCVRDTTYTSPRFERRATPDYSILNPHNVGHTFHYTRLQSDSKPPRTGKIELLGLERDGKDRIVMWERFPDAQAGENIEGISILERYRESEVRDTIRRGILTARRYK